jgi:crotonobetainyl-CoA:carnitine CoA-transferase CaiB-like acyl-CoA transferase
MPGPLTGFTVVEACQMVAGPLAGALLADMGAEVIKIEAPQGGDRMRHLGHRVGGIGAFWANVNRGKRSVVLDLQQPEGVEALRRLVARADVFLQNFRPGVVDRLGIDEPSLRAVAPELVYVSVSGFGDTGPYVDQKTYDYVIQALSGMAALQADPGTGVPALLRNVVVDKITAHSAAHAATAALLARARGRGGQHVRLSMLDVAISFLWPDGMMQHTLLDTDRVTPGPHMADSYLVRPTADGFLALTATSERQFPGLCRALGTEHWLDDPRFATLEARDANAEILSDLMGAEIALHDGPALVERLHAQDVPSALVNPVERVHLDPQVVHNGTLVVHERPWIGPVREPLPPIHFERTPSELGRHAPKLDEHTDEVLAELGYDTSAVADLRARRVIGRR